MTIFPKPRKGCPKCFERGFEGAIDQGAGKDIDVCRCIKNRIGRKDVECLTYGEFKEILAHCDRVFHLGGTYENTTQTIQGTDQSDATQRDEEQQGFSNIQS
jgi:hypothetical protein